MRKAAKQPIIHMKRLRAKVKNLGGAKASLARCPPPLCEKFDMKQDYHQLGEGIDAGPCQGTGATGEVHHPRGGALQLRQRAGSQ